ncbi:MAG TPA: hypothetical protein VFJ06_01485 [Halococcus sp.]|nr:hypothetical protein [Halococcus sp.]
MSQQTDYKERCPSCTSAESTGPIVTIDGRTLWDCTNDTCSGVRWQTETTQQGLSENPDPRTIERFLNDAAEYRDEEELQAIANDIARLYGDSRTADNGRNAEQIPTPR